MQFVIGLIIFWISIFGLSIFVYDKLHIKAEFVLPLVFASIIIIVFVAGMLNIMKLIVIICCLIGIIYFIKSILHDRTLIKRLLTDIRFYIVAFIFIFITIVGYNSHFIHYDNFSHWGLIVKNIFINDALPNFQSDFIEFKGYQPGSACFIYYFGLLCGKTEGCMIIAHNYLVFGFFTSLLAFVNKKKQIFNLLFIVGYIFVMTLNINFDSLLVDNLIAVMMISALSIMVYYRDNLKKGWMYSLIISIALILVKNTGLVLAGFTCLYLLYLGIKNKQVKQSLIYVIITGSVLMLFLYVWQRHVIMAYGNMALVSKHSLSISNIYRSLQMKGIVGILDFLKLYYSHIFDIQHNITIVYCLVINAYLFILGIVTKKRKDVLRVVLVIDILYILYWSILGIMYILSMPLEEAMMLAGFDRYMKSIIIVIIGIVIISTVELLIQSNNRFNNMYLMLIIVIMIGITLCFNSSSLYSLFGKTNYYDSIVYRFDTIISGNELTTNNNIYVYSPSSLNDAGYLQYIARYKLNTSKIKVITDISGLEEENDAFIIMIEDDLEIENWISNNNCIKVANNIYKKNIN